MYGLARGRRARARDSRRAAPATHRSDSHARHPRCVREVRYAPVRGGPGCRTGTVPPFARLPRTARSWCPAHPSLRRAGSTCRLTIAGSAFGYEKDGGERRNVEIELRHQTLQRPDLAGITDVAAAVMCGVGVEHLAPCSGKGHPDAVVVIDVRRKIRDDETAGAGGIALAHPR